MSTICADELFHDEALTRSGSPLRGKPRRSAARPRPAVVPTPVPGPRRRYEDFEARSTDLGDLLGGRIFPRLF